MILKFKELFTRRAADIPRSILKIKLLLTERCLVRIATCPCWNSLVPCSLGLTCFLTVRLVGHTIPTVSGHTDHDGSYGLDQDIQPSLAQEYLPFDEEIMQDYESMFPEENLLDALMSSSDDDDEDEGEDNINGNGLDKGPESPRISSAAAVNTMQQAFVPQRMPSPPKQQTLDSSRTRRTRKNQEFEAIQLDDIEALLDVDDAEEMENFGKVFDDEEEYQKFLEDLHAVDTHINGEDSTHDDSEDEDFIQELKEMLENQVDDCFGGAYNLFSSKPLTSEMPIEKISSLFRKNKSEENKPSKRKPKQLRRSLRLNKNDKKLYAAKLATKRNYLPLAPYAAATHHGNMKDLDTLAVVMGLPMDSVSVPSNQVPLPSEFQPGMYQALAHHVRWRTPLPRSVRKLHSHLIASKENIPQDGATVKRKKSVGYFTVEQCSILADQMKQHVQMLIQVYCMSSLQNDVESMQSTKNILLRSGDTLDMLRRLTGDVKYSEWMPCIRSIMDLTESGDLSLHSHIDLEKTPRLDIAAKIWSGLPYQVLRAMASVRVMFTPQRQPMRDPSMGVITSQMKFTPAEDRLLAWGIHKYAYDWTTIREKFLPTKKEEELKNRKKNKVGASKANIIKDVVTGITMPLTPAEIHLIDQAMHYYGKQKGKWDDICREHLVYREPRNLSMLWAQHVKSQLGEGGPRKEIRKLTS